MKYVLINDRRLFRESKFFDAKNTNKTLQGIRGKISGY